MRKETSVGRRKVGEARNGDKLPYCSSVDKSWAAEFSESLGAFIIAPLNGRRPWFSFDITQCDAPLPVPGDAVCALATRTSFVAVPGLCLHLTCHCQAFATLLRLQPTIFMGRRPSMRLESLTQQSSQEWKHECQWYDAISCSCTNEFSRLLCVSPGRRPVIFIFSCLGFLDNFKRGGRHYDWRDTISSRRWNSAYCEWIRLVHPWYLCKVPDILHVSLAVVYQLYNRG